MRRMSEIFDAAYQGTRGANSEDAAIDLLTSMAKLLPRDTLEDVFDAVSRGEARFGVVPIENTLAGSIHRCYDLLFEHDVKIVGETVRHIVFALIAPPGVALNDVRKALSHPVALAQCEHFFRQHPQIQPVSVYDTAGAVENVMRQGSRDSAAVASCRAAQVYGGVILADAIQDHAENYTRFLLISPSSAEAPRESRPLRGSPFEYLFYLDLLGRAEASPISEALTELRSQTTSLRVLGTYLRFTGN